MPPAVLTGEKNDLGYRRSGPTWENSELEGLWPDQHKIERCTPSKFPYLAPNVSNPENDPKHIEKKFRALADLWKQETQLSSSLTDIVMHMAYQRIIGMGPAVIPLILRALEKQADHWFWALHAITGADPTTPEQRGRLKEMTNAWLNWGREKGYL